MSTNPFETLIQVYSRSRFFILLILILLTIVLTPFLDEFIETRILMDIFLTAIFIAIVLAIRSKRTQGIIGSILALPLIISTWSIYFIPHSSFSLITPIFGALFFGYTVVHILRIVLQSQEVTKETIFAAVVAYALIAMTWAFLYMILELTVPGSFSFPDKSLRLATMRFEYFSFVTITTLGYGDIIPLSNKASALALLEALIGQIYLVVLVAWLVGMHVSKKAR